MLYPSRLTIREALESVSKNVYVLPPIQRAFVCNPEHICRLFEGLMRGRPLGTFLFWRIAPEQTARFKFYGFLQHYHQRDAPHCPELHELPDAELSAVIDGQQRLTALNIGLRGSMALEERGTWRAHRNAFPRKVLHLDLLAGNANLFRFKDPERAHAGRGSLWYPVPGVLETTNTAALMQWLTTAFQQRGLGSQHFPQAASTLQRLYEVVHTAPAIPFHSEQSRQLDRDVRVFLRLNDACSLTFRLVASFGFEQNISQVESGLLPIAYYLFKRNPPDTWLFTPASQAERDQIRSWLTRS